MRQSTRLPIRAAPICMSVLLHARSESLWMLRRTVSWAGSAVGLILRNAMAAEHFQSRAPHKPMAQTPEMTAALCTAQVLRAEHL